MREILSGSAYFGVFLTLIFYQAGVLIRKKLKWSVVNPLLIAVIMVISFLLLFRIDYEVYDRGAKYISYLLTPATVSLAIPLYRQLDLLKKYPLAIFGGVASGVLAAMVTIFVLSLAFGLDHAAYVTLLPKSVTTAIALGVSEKMGGIVGLTVVAVSITGIGGNVAAEFICRIFRIREPIAKGLAIGTASHAMGTSKAMEMGEVEGAMGSLSIVVAGIMTVAAVQIFARFI